MKSDEMADERARLNAMMAECDGFFKEFCRLDDAVYQDGAIPKKYKELTGLAISVATRCNECILYHLSGCNTSCSREEILEAIKLGVIAGGSITYPNARFAFAMMEELKTL